MQRQHYADDVVAAINGRWMRYEADCAGVGGRAHRRLSAHGQQITSLPPAPLPAFPPFLQKQKQLVSSRRTCMICDGSGDGGDDGPRCGIGRDERG